MMGFSLKEMTQIFVVVFLSINMVGGILGQPSKHNYSKSSGNFPEISTSKEIHKNRNQGLEKIIGRTQIPRMTQKDSNTQLAQSHETELNKNIVHINSDSHSQDKNSKNFTSRREILQNKNNLNMSTSKLGLLLLIMFLFIIFTLTCVLRFCCFFCNRREYTSKAATDVRVLKRDIENQSLVKINSSQDSRYGTFLNDDGNNNDELTALIVPVEK